MCLLGRNATSSETEANFISGSEVDSLCSNLRKLLGVEASVHERRQQLTTGLKGNHDGVSEDPSNASGILYAARGGRTAFGLACQQITTNGDMPRTIPDSTMLRLAPGSPGYNERHQQLLEGLLGQAALGGDTWVLENLSSNVRDQTTVFARYELFHVEDACQRDGVGEVHPTDFCLAIANVHVFPSACTVTFVGSPNYLACSVGSVPEAEPSDMVSRQRRPVLREPQLEGRKTYNFTAYK